MSPNGKPSILEMVSSIAKDAQVLAAELQPPASAGADITPQQLNAVKKLIETSEATLDEASQRARERRQAQIKELQNLIDSLELALTTPGLSPTAREDLKRKRRNRLTQLARLQAKEALDFGGILTTARLEEITQVLREANRAVAQRKRAAAFLGSLLKIADLALGIAGKLAGL